MYFGVQNLCLNTILALTAKFSMPPKGLILEGAENHLQYGLFMYLSVSGLD